MTYLTKKLGDIASVEWGNTSITKDQYVFNGNTAISASGPDGFLPFYENEGRAIVLSAIGARCGRCFLVGGKWTAIKNTIVIKPDQNSADVEYIYYFINNQSNWLKSGGAQPFISQKNARNLEIPLPPLETQKKIVAKLDVLLGKIKEAKKLRTEAQESTNNLLSAELNKIFTEGKEKEWKQLQLKDVVEKTTVKNTKENLPFVGMEDVESHTGRFLGSLDPANVKSVTFYFNNDCILYGKLRPYLNKVLLPNFKGHCSTEFIPLKPQSNVLREWVAYWLKSSKIVEDAMSTNTGTRMPRANLKEMMKFIIFIPPLSEQKKIVAHLDSLSENIKKIQQAQTATAEDLTALEQSILHKAFNGELI